MNRRDVYTPPAVCLCYVQTFFRFFSISLSGSSTLGTNGRRRILMAVRNTNASHLYQMTARIAEIKLPFYHFLFYFFSNLFLFFLGLNDAYTPTLSLSLTLFFLCGCFLVQTGRVDHSVRWSWRWNAQREKRLPVNPPAATDRQHHHH